MHHRRGNHITESRFLEHQIEQVEFARALIRTDNLHGNTPKYPLHPYLKQLSHTVIAKEPQATPANRKADAAATAAISSREEVVWCRELLLWPVSRARQRFDRGSPYTLTFRHLKVKPF
jgi:hypothetical protein